MASPKAHEDYYVRRPDNIKPADKHLYPHIGGIFHDNVPKGKEAISMHGYTDDATPPSEREHELSKDCWCNPEVEIVPPNQEVSDADGRLDNSADTEVALPDQPILHERSGKAGAHRK